MDDGLCHFPQHYSGTCVLRQMAKAKLDDGHTEDRERKGK